MFIGAPGRNWRHELGEKLERDADQEKKKPLWIGYR